MCVYCARSMKKTNVIYLHARHLPPVYICILLDVSKQVECLVALCRAYVEVSTHIYGVFQEIDGKMFIFRVNLGM